MSLKEKSFSTSTGSSEEIRADELEPTVEAGPAPVVFMIVLGLMVFWAMNYLDWTSGGFNPKVYEPYRSLVAVKADQPYDPVTELAARGKRVFDGNCLVCHQASGQGLPGQFPPLAGSEWVTTPGANRIIRIVLNGLQGPIKVKGIDFNNNMFPFEDILTKDEDVAAVLTYIRQEWGNKAPPVTPEEVKAIRAQIKGHPQWTPDQLLAIPDSGEVKP